MVVELVEVMEEATRTSHYTQDPETWRSHVWPSWQGRRRFPGPIEGKGEFGAVDCEAKRKYSPRSCPPKYYTEQALGYTMVGPSPFDDALP